MGWCRSPDAGPLEGATTRRRRATRVGTAAHQNTSPTRPDSIASTSMTSIRLSDLESAQGEEELPWRLGSTPRPHVRHGADTGGERGGARGRDHEGRLRVALVSRLLGQRCRRCSLIDWRRRSLGARRPTASGRDVPGIGTATAVCAAGRRSRFARFRAVAGVRSGHAAAPRHDKRRHDDQGGGYDVKRQTHVAKLPRSPRHARGPWRILSRTPRWAGGFPESTPDGRALALLSTPKSRHGAPYKKNAPSSASSRRRLDAGDRCILVAPAVERASLQPRTRLLREETVLSTWWIPATIASRSSIRPSPWCNCGGVG